MKRFDNFGEYMFSLLFAPLKKGKSTANQFRIFFRVMGREFDDIKAAFFRVREESDVASCSAIMLPVHGQDRDMARLPGEDAEAYRTRLSMKGIISEWGGTKSGILYALAALGWDRSYVEPVSYTDPERWAEFIVFLGGRYPSGVNDINVIDVEVRKVKEGSSKPQYGLEERSIVEIREQSRAGFYGLPICGRLKCGQHPGLNNNVGYLLRSQAGMESGYHEGRFGYILSGDMRAQEPPYRKGGILEGQLQKSASELRAAYHEGQFPYTLSGSTRLSQGEDNGRAGASALAVSQEFTFGQFAYKLSGSTRLSQGEDNGKAGASAVGTAQEFKVGFVEYPRSGQYRAGQRKE